MKNLKFLVVLALVALLATPAIAADTIKIGFNIPLTGDIPEVGEGSKNAAEMYLNDINSAGGLEVGGKKYPVEIVLEDNESKAESAVKANTKMITQDDTMFYDDVALCSAGSGAVVVDTEVSVSAVTIANPVVASFLSKARLPSALFGWDRVMTPSASPPDAPTFRYAAPDPAGRYVAGVPTPRR